MSGTWILRLLVAVVYWLISYQTISGHAYFITQLDDARWFRLVVAPLEIIGVVAVLIPRATRVGVALLFLGSLADAYGMIYFFPKIEIDQAFSTEFLTFPLLIALFLGAGRENSENVIP